MKYKRTINIVILVLIILEIMLSAYLIYQDKTLVTNLCVLGSSCESVHDSLYGQIFGIKLPYISIFLFIGLLGVFYYNKKLFLIGSIAGGLISLYLIIVQLFVLNQICSTCMIIDLTMIAILILGWINRKNYSSAQNS